MKLASLKAGRDGRLVVVSRDLARCTPAGGIAPTLQAALESWSETAPRLRRLSDDLESGRIEGQRFDQTACAAPLPRAYQWLDGSAYVTHVELVRKARGAELPERFWTDPLMYQGASDGFIGPREPIEATSEDWGVDLEAEVGVITDRVPMGTPAARAGEHIKLVLLVNDVTARALIPDELAKGFGFVHGKPATAFSPVAVTPDELGAAWRDTAVLVVTEFGRTVAVNGTRGTDHGTATCALLVGGAVAGGRVSADWPGLDAGSLYQSRDLRPTTDLRSICKGVLAEHLGVDDAALNTRVFPDSRLAKPSEGLIAQREGDRR